ncbi:MAG: hypothetical protein JO131_01420 [Gammaproteobacteria bacterium]|nr:hypothetical protein [Gammaproteobacteria bacterium]
MIKQTFIIIFVILPIYFSTAHSQENTHLSQGVCIRLGQRNIGSTMNHTFYQITAIGTHGESTTITSLPIQNDLSANPSYYYFHAKDVNELKALKVNTLTMTKGHGLLKLSCNNMLIEPHAKSADIAIQEDHLDQGECLLSVTPYQNKTIIPCVN